MQKFGYPQTQCALNENIFFVANCRPYWLETRNEGLRHWLWYWRFGLLYGKKFWMWRYVFRLLKIFSWQTSKKNQKVFITKMETALSVSSKLTFPNFLWYLNFPLMEKNELKREISLRQSLLRYHTQQKCKIKTS